MQVIAAQCTSMGELTQLDKAARKLHDVLTDPDLGGCRARAGSHPSLLVGDDLTTEDVEKAVDSALQQAKADSAVLVLAMLGHGFTPPQRSELYFMVRDSTTQSTRSAVDVGRVLTEAADEPGVDGLIAIVDTCHAGGAVPDAGRLAGGVRAGRSRLAILTAAAADQPARDMSLSLSLAKTLRAGVPGAGPALYVDRVLAEALRDHVSGQVIGRAEYDQDPFPLEGLWLARNPSHTVNARADVVGSLGLQDLMESVELWRGPRRSPRRVTRAALRELQDFVSSGQVDDERRPDAREDVEGVVTGLLEAFRTKEFLMDALSDSLTSDLLRSARRLAGFPSLAEGTVPIRDLLEYAVLRTRRRRETPWKGLSRIVTALFHQAGLPRTHAGLQDWARRLDVLTEVNDAYGEFAADRQRRALRLVISLAGAWTEWPEEVDAWLLRGGEGLPLHQRFPCEAGGSHGAAKAIGAALHWARRELPHPELLEHIDIAAPTHLLARWHPEEEKVGRYLLGARYSVTPRWSGRLDQAEDNAEINDAARKALKKMANCGATHVTWIDQADLHDRSALEYRLSAGQYDTAVGVDHRPEDLEDVLDLFLPFAPIVLWARGDARPAAGRLPELVRERWHELPDGLADAYRSRWEAHRDCTACLGDIRAVWHDEAWLEFCRPFEHRVVTTPKEET
ncbi:caspase family protein [Streptomyces sp. WSLK1-5]|uniref:vWA-MoxR associated conflict system protein n=1 Tax=Streptomyces sp. WSLK1-3 TaxID=3375475 RepID=UPI00379A4FA5